MVATKQKRAPEACPPRYARDLLPARLSPRGSTDHRPRTWIAPLGDPDIRLAPRQKPYPNDCLLGAASPGRFVLGLPDSFQLRKISCSDQGHLRLLSSALPSRRRSESKRTRDVRTVTCSSTIASRDRSHSSANCCLPSRQQVRPSPHKGLVTDWESKLGLGERGGRRLRRPRGTPASAIRARSFRGKGRRIEIGHAVRERIASSRHGRSGAGRWPVTGGGCRSEDSIHGRRGPSGA